MFSMPSALACRWDRDEWNIWMSICMTASLSSVRAVAGIDEKQSDAAWFSSAMGQRKCGLFSAIRSGRRPYNGNLLLPVRGRQVLRKLIPLFAVKIQP